MPFAEETVWTFATANFRVELRIAPEDMDPADSFQFDDDIEAVRSGAVEWFQARVVVSDVDGCELGSDSLGGCAYETVREFFTAHRDPNPLNRNSTLMRRAWRNGNDPNAKISICHYFPDMVSQAIAEARKSMARRLPVYAANASASA